MIFSILIPLAFAIGVFEPNIECTVIKVHSKVKIQHLGPFPKKYQSINNDPTRSQLIIANHNFKGVDPMTLIKTKKFEKIKISLPHSSWIIELHGEPISRSGTLKIDGTKVADLTCH